MRHNDIAESSVKFLDSTAEYPQAPGVVLIKVPKTMALLEQQLRALRQVVTPQTRIIAAQRRVISTLRRWSCLRKCWARPPPRWPGKSAPDQLYFQHRSWPMRRRR
jgi:16S rRNA G1207 methylase RsmC